jgi:hypothetical protein
MSVIFHVPSMGLVPPPLDLLPDVPLAPVLEPLPDPPGSG